MRRLVAEEAATGGGHLALKACHDPSGPATVRREVNALERCAPALGLSEATMVTWEATGIIETGELRIEMRPVAERLRPGAEARSSAADRS